MNLAFFLGTAVWYDCLSARSHSHTYIAFPVHGETRPPILPASRSIRSPSACGPFHAVFCAVSLSKGIVIRKSESIGNRKSNFPLWSQMWAQKLAVMKEILLGCQLTVGGSIKSLFHKQDLWMSLFLDLSLRSSLHFILQLLIKLDEKLPSSLRFIKQLLNKKKNKQ